MKVVTIHQPHFLPWCGYFNKIFNSDVFVILDDVQFRRRYYQNRTKILVNNKLVWLTLPIKHRFKSLINEAEIVGKRWREKTVNSIFHTYHDYPYFNDFWPEIKEIISDSDANLNTINSKLLILILNKLNYNGKIVFSSDTPRKNLREKIDLSFYMKKYEGTHLIYGKGNGLKYAGGKSFYKKKGVEILNQSFIEKNNFIKNEVDGLSVIDILFKYGAKKGKEIILYSWKVNYLNIKTFNSIMNEEKHQAIFIRGGEAFNTKEAFYAYIKNRNYNPYDKSKRWTDWLEWSLSEHFDTFTPLMPNKQWADFEAWKIWFEKLYPYINPNPNIKLILIGQSLGGIFLTKYLSENDFPKKIDQLHLVSPVYDNKDLPGEEEGGFVFEPGNLRIIEDKAEKIFLYHSKDDDSVPYTHSLKYLEYLKKAKFYSFEDRGHFAQPAFMEILQTIKENL